ncbi:MAG: hypothetical protein ACTSUQ_09375 [Candidatus Freyarchaeota archaeon]
MVEKEIVEDEILSLTRELVKIPSYQEVEDGERKVAECLAAFLRDNGLSPKICELEKGVNLIVSIGDAREGSPSLMFNGHLDTVPVDNMTIPPL